MTALDASRSDDGRQVRLRRVFAYALVALAACTGENIFPLSVSSGGGSLGPPEVQITAPAASAALTLGDSVQVTASVTAENGVGQVTFLGTFDAGASAYVQQVVPLSGQADTTLSRFLQPAGTVTGAARIIVQATDLLGNQGADTVSVTVN